MFCWHKWSKWKDNKIIGNYYVDKMIIQKKQCTKCDKVKYRKIRYFENSLILKPRLVGAKPRTRRYKWWLIPFVWLVKKMGKQIIYGATVDPFMDNKNIYTFHRIDDKTAICFLEEKDED